MIKNTVIAFATAAALAGIAVPAMAAPVAEESSNFDSDYVLIQLQQQGVNASAVEEWGDYVRAFVVGEDGTETMQLFTPVTLNPVNS